MEFINSETGFFLNPSIDNELGKENINNLVELSGAIKEEANKQNIDTHLILVGGNVDPRKQGKYHKDIDVLLYSPQLATELYYGGECHKFDSFAAFISKVADNIGWNSKIDKPFFQDYFFCGDGKITLFTNNKPIEVLPVRKDSLKNSFEEFKKNIDRPFAVVY